MKADVAIPVIISLIGVLISAITTAIIVGARWGKMETKLDSVVRDVSEIRGMFTLTLKKPSP